MVALNNHSENEVLNWPIVGNIKYLPLQLKYTGYVDFNGTICNIL